MAQIEVNERNEYDISLKGLTETEISELIEALDIVDRQLPDGLPTTGKWFLESAHKLRTHKYGYTPQTFEIDPDIPL